MNEKLFTQIKDLVIALREAGVRVDLSISLGEQEVVEDPTISDLGTQPAHHGDIQHPYLGFSSPAGEQFWEDEDL